MADLLTIFESVAVLTFALTLLFAGLFTAYFGAGKSRVIGGILIIISIAALGGFWYIWGASTILETVIWPALMTIFAAGVGGAVAVAIFLFAIMKS